MAAQKTVPFAKIDMNAGTQTRAKVRNDVIEEYAECAGQLPPVVLFTEDGVVYFPGAGFHRIPAFVKAGLTEIPAEVRKGGRREALLFSAGDNHDHGVRRTAEDKRNAVKMLLQDAEWKERSDRWIADACKVGDHLVADIRADNGQKEEHTGYSGARTRTSCEPRAGQDGKTYTKKNAPLCERCVRIGARTPPDCANCKALEGDKVAKKREAEEERQRKAAEAKAERDRKAAERQAAEDKKKADKEAEREAREDAKKAEAKRKKEAAAERERERMAAQKARDQEREEKRHKNGQEKFNYREFQTDFGAVVRWVERLANAYQAKNSPEYQRCEKKLDEFRTEMEKWYSKLTTRKAPSHMMS